MINQLEQITFLKVKDAMLEAPSIVSLKTGIRNLLKLLRDYQVILVSKKGDI